MTIINNETNDDESHDYESIDDSIKCFGMNNRKGKNLKIKNKGKKGTGKSSETRSRYRIVVKADLNKMKNIDSYCLPSIYMNTRNCYNIKPYRPKLSS